MTVLPDGPVRRSSSLGLLIGAVCLALQTAGSSAQSQQPAQPQQPTFRAEANLVRVDVFATAGESPVLDLRQDEFQVFEDGAPQKVETFEHVVRRPGGARVESKEPNTVGESNEMAADPHNGVFVLFLDGPHVSFSGANIVAEPLVRFVDRVLGPDDLIGLMRPEMSASAITFARKTTIIERGLREDTLWGRRNRIGDFDAVEESYTYCYPPLPGESGTISAVAREMILRRREKATLDAIRDTVLHLNTVREGRKAVVVVSEGWVLYRPGSTLLAEQKPSVPQIYVSPRGTLTTSNERNSGGMDRSACDSDRMMLAELDDQTYYRDILRVSQNSNVSFYPVDPRGLVVFDTDLGGLEVPLNAIADSSQLRFRLETLRTLASATDGIAVVDSNNLDRGLKRVSDDLSSFYLLGYYTTNTKLDGSYRRISVKVTRPGVTIRARRGYRAASAEEIAKAARVETLATEGAAGVEASLSRELATLAGAVPNAELHLRAVVEPVGRGATLWVSGELGDRLVRGPAWTSLQRDGAEVRVMVSAEGARGATLGAARVKLTPGARAFTSRLSIDSISGVREVLVQAQISGESAGEGRGSGAVSVQVPEAGPRTMILSPLLYRGAPGAAAEFQPAAYPQFRRTEVLRAEALIGSDATGLSGRLLDRTGKPMAVPVAVTERADETAGRRWLVSELALAPLTTGEYVLALAVERRGERQEILTAFRVVR